MVTLVGMYTTWCNFSISSACLIDFPWDGKSPLSFQIAACACTTPKAYIEYVQMLILFSFAISRVMIFASWADVPGERGFTSITLLRVVTAYPVRQTLWRMKLLPSICQSSACSKDVSFMSGQLEYTVSMVSMQ